MVINCYGGSKGTIAGVLSIVECAIKALCASNKVTIDRLLKHVKWATVSEG